MSGFKVEFSILNLRATPGIYADALASRPAAGYPGRVFIDTDNPSTGIYRDTGTVWVQIAETATSDVDTLQNVTDNGNTTTNSISVGHANTPVSTIDVRQSTSGLNNASNWTITANNNPTIASGATFGTNYVNAIYGAQTQLFLQNATIGNSGLNTAGLFINTLQSNAPGSPGIITVTQASTIRAISGTQTGIYYGGTNVGVTYSHVAALKTFQPINTGSAATVTNNYGLIVADSTPSSGTITYTNRWGIYQEGASDKNYFAANVLIKSNTDNGNALQVTGTSSFSDTIILSNYAINRANNRGYFTGTSDNFGFFYDGTNGVISVTPGSLTFYTSNTEQMRITSGGDVGIGTSAPINSAGYRTLTLGGGSTNYGQITWNSSTTVIGYAYNDGTNMNIGSNAALIFRTTSSATERMRITSDGEVLIATTTDVGDYKLQVNGNAYTNGNIELSGVSAGTRYVILTSDTTYTGNLIMQAGFGSAGAGGGIILYGHSHASFPGWVKAGISNLSGGKFSVNTQGLGNGTDVFTVDVSGNSVQNGSIKTAAGAIINDSQGNNDTQIKGDNNANLFFCDASQDSIGIATATIDASALLQMDSTTKGLLIPRMTTTERDNIVSPAIGLLIFNTTTNRLNIYDGAWIAVH